MKYPKRHLINFDFKYVRSENTDVRKTFERIRESLKKAPKIVSIADQRKRKSRT